MLTIEINKTFKNQAECDKWKEENLPDRKYKGHVSSQVELTIMT